MQNGGHDTEGPPSTSQSGSSNRESSSSDSESDSGSSTSAASSSSRGYERLADPRFPSDDANYLTRPTFIKFRSRAGFRVNFVVTPESAFSGCSQQIIQVLNLRDSVKVQQTGRYRGMEYIVGRVHYRRIAYERFYIFEGPGDFRMGRTLASKIGFARVTPDHTHELPEGYDD